MDIVEKIFEEERNALLDEIRQVEEGTHPELVRQMRQIEEEHDRWVNVTLPFMRQQLERDAQLQYEAAIELAKKNYSVGSVLAKKAFDELAKFQESFEEMREKLLHQLKEERAGIEHDYYYDDLDSYDGLFLPPPRKLRPRFSDVAPPCDIEQKTSTSVRVLNTSLSDAEIEQCLNDIRALVAREVENKADKEAGASTPVVNAEQFEEYTFTASSQWQSPSSICSSNSNFDSTVTELKSEQDDELPSSSQVQSPKQKAYKVGKKVVILGPGGITRGTILKIECGRIFVITERVKRIITITEEEIEKRTYLIDPPAATRFLRKSTVSDSESEEDEESDSTSEELGGRGVDTVADSGDESSPASSP